MGKPGSSAVVDAFVSFLCHCRIDEFCRLLEVLVGQTQLNGRLKCVHTTGARSETGACKGFDLPYLITVVSMHRSE